MDDIKLIMNKLKRVRQKRGVSAEEVKREVGIACSHLSRVESGEVDLKMSTFLRYLRAIGYKIKLIKMEL